MEISEKMLQQLASDNDDIPHATSLQTNCMVWYTLRIVSVETNHVVWLAMVALIASPNQEDQVWPLPGWLCSGMVWNLHWLLNWRTDFPMIPGIVTWLNSYFLTHDQSMKTTKPLVNMSAACCNKQPRQQPETFPVCRCRRLRLQTRRDRTKSQDTVRSKEDRTTLTH